MHDPMTQIFSWPKYDSWLYRIVGEQLVLWHVDPEKDGSDDSCGWFWAKPMPPEAEKLIDEMVKDEASHPWYATADLRIRDPRYRYYEARPGDALALTIGAYRHVAWRLHKRPLSARLLDEAISLATNPWDNIAASFAPDKPVEVRRLFFIIVRNYLRHQRPWYRHPRWHIHHWRLQIRPWQKFVRAWFERCSKCGKGYSWNYTPMGSWGGKDTWHQDCANPRASHGPCETNKS
jgi:hypothetical protein